jgi:putative Holliday junction resolvase
MNPLGRILGLDVGHVRIGVALSDPLGILASPHSVIQCTTPEQDAEAIAALVREHEVKTIVAGLPLNQHGEEGPQAAKTREFLDILKQRVDVDIDTMDERFTSAIAERILIGANMRRDKRKKVIDKVAAQQILQVYLDRRSRSNR